MERRGGAAGRPREDGELEARHPTPIMGAREQPPSKRRRVGVVWDEGNLAKHSAERQTPEHPAEEHVFFADPRDEAEISAAADTLRLDDSLAAVLPPEIGPASHGRSDSDGDDSEDAARLDPGSSGDEADAGGVAPPAVVPVPLPAVVVVGPGIDASDSDSEDGRRGDAEDGAGGGDEEDGSGEDSSAGDSSSPRAGGAPPRIGGGDAGAHGVGGRPVSKFSEMRRKHYDEGRRLEEFRRRAEVEDDSEDEESDGDDDGDRSSAGAC